MARAPIQLITLEEAKAHVYEEDTEKDDDIDLKISMASELVMDHIKLEDVPDKWIVTQSPLVIDPPFRIKAATLLVFGELFANRESSTADPISDAVRALLRRPPTLA